MHRVRGWVRKAGVARSIAAAFGFITIWMGAGCASYKTPGSAASFRAMGITVEDAEAQTDASIARKLARKPLAGFPSNLAVVRVQGPEYCSRTARGYGFGRYSIVSTRDVEPESAFTRIEPMPMVEGVATLNRLVMPQQLDSEEDLRKAAATVQADMLLLYTFDTQFETSTKVKPLGLVTLGLFPDRVARVTSTASAALLDTRNGYVYGLAEGTGEQEQLSNAWNSEEALDEARLRAEKLAFEKLVNAFEATWGRVVARYAQPTAGQSADRAAARSTESR
ncbi:MAG: hypothetical protein L0Y44_06900 [Phycisphaerales bacterium]|nr:hypothetical protein [Phycisphaerales bacterium]MCI0630368.1 hypothetical protein [Phycisphaerales bacterium]MCI0676646.1 hypothetical protein [Phycisphaerales bacterium]